MEEIVPLRLASPLSRCADAEAGAAAAVLALALVRLDRFPTTIGSTNRGSAFPSICALMEKDRTRRMRRVWRRHILYVKNFLKRFNIFYNLKDLLPNVTKKSRIMSC